MPDLDTVFYGSLLHAEGEAYSPEMIGDSYVVAKLGGRVIGQTELTPGSSMYVLKVPKDDGQEPRLEGTTRAGERIQLFLKRSSTSQEEEVLESLSQGGFSIPSERGGVVNADLSVTADFGGMTQEMVRLAAFAEEYSLPSSSPVIAAVNNEDGDVFSDYDEFIAGTDPTSSVSKFRIIELSQRDGSNFVKFGPIVGGRVYTIWCTESLAPQAWSVVGHFSPLADADFLVFGHAQPNAESFFYRLEVKLADSPSNDP